MSLDHYVLRGGAEGRERLRLLARVMNPSTLALLERVGVPPGARCLDVGCGGGDVTRELARLAGPRGSAVGLDLDPAVLALAGAESLAQGIANAEFRAADADGPLGAGEFDLVYSRFLLTHLCEPAACLERMRDALRPGGLLVVEDIDGSGTLCYPPSEALRRYSQLYRTAVRARGGDPDIGQRLPLLLLEAGLEPLGVQVAQPLALQGEAKWIQAITLPLLADALLAQGLSHAEELEKLAAELAAFAADPRSLVSTARIVQTWGRRAH